MQCVGRQAAARKPAALQLATPGPLQQRLQSLGEELHPLGTRVREDERHLPAVGQRVEHPRRPLELARREVVHDPLREVLPSVRLGGVHMRDVGQCHGDPQVVARDRDRREVPRQSHRCQAALHKRLVGRLLQQRDGVAAHELAHEVHELIPLHAPNARGGGHLRDVGHVGGHGLAVRLVQRRRSNCAIVRIEGLLRQTRSIDARHRRSAGHHRANDDQLFGIMSIVCATENRVAHRVPSPRRGESRKK
mmetsp:Transcript_31068/g.88662  ORF Transcript_31068/g.88662 Transcript_31068/m.88662 type:complete len:249 (-) Transcript_31068:6-752(-)